MSDQANALQEKLTECVGAGQTFLTIRSADYVDVENDIREACQKQFGWEVWFWDSHKGLETPQGFLDVSPPPAEPSAAAAAAKGLPPSLAQAAAKAPKQQLRGASLLIAAVRAFEEWDNRDDPDGPAKPNADEPRRPMILVVRDLHRYWRPGHGPANDDKVHDLIALLRHFIRTSSMQAKFLVGLMPDCESAKVPPELESDATVIRHKPPAKEEFRPIIETIDTSGTQIELTETEMDMIAEASCGLTRQQASQAYGIAAARYVKLTLQAKEAKTKPPSVGQFYAGVVEEVKNEILNVDGIITRYPGKERFADVGGNDALKDFGMRAMRPKARRKPSRIRAVAVVGPPGTGKTLFAKSLGNEVGYKTYAVDLGKCKGKYVGESEAGVRSLYARMDAMAPIIAYYDEVNEQIASGGGDEHSVDKAILQTTLVWLNDHTSDVFVVLTANDVSKMHMALLRPGRVDAIWYVGLPGKVQKQRIWEISMATYGVEDQDLPDDAGWAGAEISACCRIADALDVSLQDAAKYIIPTSVRVRDQIDALKDWANGRCLDAETGEVYKKDKETPPEATGGLRVKRKIRAVK